MYSLKNGFIAFVCVLVHRVLCTCVNSATIFSFGQSVKHRNTLLLYDKVSGR